MKNLFSLMPDLSYPIDDSLDFIPATNEELEIALLKMGSVTMKAQVQSMILYKISTKCKCTPNNKWQAAIFIDDYEMLCSWYVHVYKIYGTDKK